MLHKSSAPQWIAIGAIVALIIGLGIAGKVAQKLTGGAVGYKSIALDSYPAPTPMKATWPGVNMFNANLTRGGAPMAVWVYLPQSPPPGKLPAILIAPAGSRLFHGMSLVKGDQAEHWPWVDHGFAVIAYTIDGPLPPRPTDPQCEDAFGKFRKAHFGVDNASAALDYVAKTFPQIDMTRIYAVGHSSAATLALQVAQHDRRIAACVAFAPCVDVPQHLLRAADALNQFQDGAMDAIAEYSPNNNLSSLRCPTMLFTAFDDQVVTTESVKSFAADLKKTNRQVNLVTVQTSGHYDSMIRDGIPAAIKWLSSLSPAPVPATH